MIKKTISKFNFKSLPTGLGVILCLLGISIATNQILAFASITSSPQMIDLKVKPGDSLEKTLILNTSSNYKLDIYAVVNNFDPVGGLQPFLDPSIADKTTSLANWIIIRRGVIEALPGKQKLNIDFSVRVDSFAKPGIYHAAISFGAAGSNSTQVMINLEVPENSQEYLYSKKFIVDKVFFYKSPISFFYELENRGNRSLIPKGAIIIYNRHGQEVASIISNPENVIIPPGKTVNFISQWSDTRAIGRYKAVLNLQYGEVNPGVLQDVTFFYFFTWWKIIIFFIVIISLSVVFVYLLYRQHEKNN